MIEALISLIWTVIKDKVEPRVSAAVRFVVVPLSNWFSQLAVWAKLIVLSIGSIACVALVGAALTLVGIPVVNTLHNLTVASFNTHSAPLSKGARHRASIYVNAWGQILLDEYRRRVAARSNGTKQVDETAWTLAQQSIAIEGMVFNGDHVDGRELLDYAEADSESECSCWREIENTDESLRRIYPRHVAISAWILVGLARLSPRLPVDHLQFLQGMQLRNGAWPALIAKSDNQGSTFATPWVILALLNASKNINNDDQQREIARHVSSGVNWLLDKKRENGLWALYPDLENSNAQQLSLSNSGLVIFALHQVARFQSLRGRELIASRWLERLEAADRDLLRQLRPGIGVGVADQYNAQVATMSDGIPVERVQLLVLPWLLIGAIDAYKSGSLLERMNAVSFLDDVVARLDVIDLELRKPDNLWIMPEMLMALRYWSDATYLRQLPGIQGNQATL